MPLGFDRAGLTLAAFDLGLGGYSRDDGDQLRSRALDAIRQLPGVSEAAYGNSLPLYLNQNRMLIVPDEAGARNPLELPLTITYEVSPGFLRTLGVRLRNGRDVESRDTRTSPRVAVVNDTFVTQLLHGREAVGQHVRVGPGGPFIEIVGVVADGKYQTLTESHTPAVFMPILQQYNTATVLVVRSSLPSYEVAGAIQRVMHDLDPALALFEVGPLERMLGLVLLPMRVAGIALGGFGLLAVMLAATGIHGLIAYAVTRRRREVAIRVALGATHKQILRLVVGRTAVLVGSGLLVGMALAIATRRLLQAVVYEASPADPLTLLMVIGVMGGVGLISCWGPTRRSLRLSPAKALHAD
jgi:predicted permease